MQKETNRQIYYAITAYLIFAILILIFTELDVLSLAQDSSLRTNFLLIKNGFPYFLAALALSAIAVCIKIRYKGSDSKTIFNGLHGIALAFIAYFMFDMNILPISTQNLSIYIFLLITAASTLYMLNNILKNRQQFTPLAIASFATVTCIGVILRFTALAAGQSDLIADIIMYGFFFGAVTALFYPLRYSKKSYAKKLGTWIGSGTTTKIILGIVIATYVLFIRPYFSSINENWTLIGEWIFIGVFAGASFLLIRAKLEDISAPAILAKWTKHTQELNFKPSEEINILSRNIDQFLQTGNKDGITWFLFDFLTNQNVSHDKIYSVLKELFNHQNLPNPKLILPWDLALFEESEKTKRKKVVENMIKKLNPELFRGNKGVN